METTLRQTRAFLFRGYHLTRRYISWVIVFNFYALVTSATVALRYQPVFADKQLRADGDRAGWTNAVYGFELSGRECCWGAADTCGQHCRVYRPGPDSCGVACV